jgi:hypothetical protein
MYRFESLESGLVSATSTAVFMAKRARPQDAAETGAHHSGYHNEVRALRDKLETYEIPRYTKRKCGKDGRSQASERLVDVCTDVLCLLSGQTQDDAEKDDLCALLADMVSSSGADVPAGDIARKIAEVHNASKDTAMKRFLLQFVAHKTHTAIEQYGFTIGRDGKVLKNVKAMLATFGGAITKALVGTCHVKKNVRCPYTLHPGPPIPSALTSFRDAQTTPFRDAKNDVLYPILVTPNLTLLTIAFIRMLK